ncbi:MAG: GNAT family N-acetyltransferase [Candidatus Gastranaerophilales bacterium]|nr:GNAT family N-acetyltransferase [Candidatus Gastranaerophilales bacterium]
MTRIRKAGYFDKFKLKKMISFLSTDIVSYYTKVFMNFPFNIIHDLLPLSLKFLPESYVIEENKEIIGMITVTPTQGNPYKLNIIRLFLEHNCFNAGKQLIDFVISKYGAKGATAFIAKIDDSYDELLSLFVDGCGFRQCSSEQMWKMELIRFSQESNSFFRPFKNSDAPIVAMLFNDSVITHFKYSIVSTKNEYWELFFKGLKDSKFKYVIEDENLKTIKAYLSITTSDNLNYILDIIASPWHECSWEDILSFTINQISKRQKDFYLFVKVRKYTTTAENFENYLTEQNFKRVQNQLVLVKDFYKQIKEAQPISRVVLFNEVNEKPVFKI